MRQLPLLEMLDLGETTVINDVLKETTKEFASLIVAEIEAKQTNGTLDLSDTNDASVAAILQIKETQRSHCSNWIR